MPFPDQSHMDRVREALWDRPGSGASVMVGSGLTRCALKARPSSPDAPLWQDLAMAVTDRLYPLNACGRRAPDNSRPRSTDDFLRIAQEYETAFGRSELHRFLLQQVRDDDFTPGESHDRLLRLPWRDVFTTNWDTLLERTRSRIVERGYSTIEDKGQIPLASQPRIVKLHGSLPAQFPLIFTEEDFRTYPAKFALFVNTVQQAMMESAFFLIGFSGNDPNFLHWSGWVRDQLGAAAPRIYLAGWLALSPHRRRMLEDRGVVPIDLAHHPRAQSWPDHLRHRYAIDWVLHSLERGQPYDVTNWPSPMLAWDSTVPSLLQPVVELTGGQPLEESAHGSQGGTATQLDQVRQTLRVWKHNRMLYPGWLVFPSGEERETLNSRTEEWEPHILRVFPEMEIVERLGAIQELVWRREILLQPLSPALESVAEAVLISVDCSNRSIEESVNTEIDWIGVREAWRDVALSLVTAARFRFDRDLFHRRVESLGPFLDDDTNVAHRLQHERCLWGVYSADFESLDGLLSEWRVEDCDLVWKVRKAALLWESHRDDEASELASAALYSIRMFSRGDNDVASASRESWAMWSSFSMDKRRLFDKRWEELARLKCDASFERDLITRRLTESRGTSEAPSFDIGRSRGNRVTFSNSRPSVAAYRAIRLTEVAGLPPAVRHREFFGADVGGRMLKQAATNIVGFDQELAARLILRTCTYDKDDVLQSVFSRTSVALLPIESVQELASECTSLIGFGLVKGWVEKTSVAIEVLSRLVLRLDANTALAIFDKSLEYYSSHRDRVLSHFWLHEPIGNLMRRSWETILHDSRSSRGLSVLGAPIVGLDGFELQIPDHQPDPGNLLGGRAGEYLTERVPENEDSWRAISSLLVRGLKTGGEARRRAAARLAVVASKGKLTASEISEIGNALWSEEYTPVDDLPQDTDLFDWAFLVFPEPQPLLADQRFRHKWLSPRSINPMEGDSDADGTIDISLNRSRSESASIENTLWNVGAAISICGEHERPFALDDNERKRIIDLIDSWAKTDISGRSVPFFQGLVDEPTFIAIDGLTQVLAHVEIPQRVAEDLYRKLKTLTEAGIPAFKPIGELAKLMPSQTRDMVSWLRSGLASVDAAMVQSALACVASWPSNSDEEAPTTPRLPNDIYREVGLIIASRRIPSLSSALEVAKLVFDSETEEETEALSEFALQGLSYLSGELTYGGNQDSTVDVPLLRLRCTELALSMSRAGFENDPTIVRWLELATHDPYPEIRHAVEISNDAHT